MAKDNTRYSPVSDRVGLGNSRGCVRERGTALPPDNLRRHDGAPRLSPQGRKEWENEWATVAFVPDGDQGFDPKTGAPKGRYVYVTSSPQNVGKVKMLTSRYPTTTAYLLYISVIVSLLLILQILNHG